MLLILAQMLGDAARGGSMRCAPARPGRHRWQAALWRRRAWRASVARRRDREVRCDAGAAPATVSGEIATRATGGCDPAGEGARAHAPAPGAPPFAPRFAA